MIRVGALTKNRHLNFVFLERVEDACKKDQGKFPEPPKVILSCSDAKEKGIIRYKWPSKDEVSSALLTGTEEVLCLKSYKKTFHSVRAINMKRNPKKCFFAVKEELFLRHAYHHEGSSILFLRIRKHKCGIVGQKREEAISHLLCQQGIARGQVLSKPENLGSVARWAFELGMHKIEFKGRNFIKGQILTDLLAETPSDPNEEKIKKRRKQTRTLKDQSRMESVYRGQPQACWLEWNDVGESGFFEVDGGFNGEDFLLGDGGFNLQGFLDSNVSMVDEGSFVASIRKG
ncbi:hypothetical protein Tco_0679301 [Tanacetum coccineum]|uniref:Uncharacterized protein n=1 Tax=Tanacetum coccineum TaxID=301880 RepID=A0ABQ4XIX6_9ASTR